MSVFDDHRHISVFDEYRNLLFSVAYRLLGSAADAEDAVQDAWLRWSAADRAKVADPKAYLVRIVTNLAMDRLRSARRETYVGPWLPEPILTSGEVPDVAPALLLVLENLTPLERAVFVLREAFAFSYEEIAQAVDRSPDSVRQAAHRAREHVRSRRPRFPANRDRQRAVTERFFAAAAGGDINVLMELLAPEVTLWTDGGGKVRQALRPVSGAERVAAWLTGVGSRPYEGVRPDQMSATVADLNGSPALVIRGAGRVLATLALELDEDGRVTTILNTANPDKLAAVQGGVVRVV